MKRNTEAAAGKLTDEALSRKLGNCQRAESIGMLLGIPCVIAGCVLAFVRHDVALFALLFFGGVGLILLVSLPAQKKKKALLQQQLGDYFQAELDRVFGPAPETPALPIDRSYLAEAGLVALPWTECAADCFREGVHRGLRFSAANVELRRVVEERSGPDNDNWMSRMETVFRGVVIRCGNLCAPGTDLVIRDGMQKLTDSDWTDPAAFRQRFTVHTAEGRAADALVTPELRTLLRDFEKAGAGRLCGLVLRDSTAALALETQYLFADIPDALDMRNVDGVRKWYTATLTGMGRLLDMLLNSPALSGGAEKQCEEEHA